MDKIISDLTQLSQTFSFAGTLYIIMRLELFIQKTNLRLNFLEERFKDENTKK